MARHVSDTDGDESAKDGTPSRSCPGTRKRTNSR